VHYHDGAFYLQVRQVNAPPFFKLLKKSGPIQWIPEADAALQELKEYLASPPILVMPRTGEPLLLYVAAINQLVSVVLVVEQEEDPKVAKPKAVGCSQQPSPNSPPSEEAAGEYLLALGVPLAMSRLV
jgi:hypothetical protein